VSADPVTFLTSPRRPGRLARQPSTVRDWDVSSARSADGDSLPLRFEDVFRRYAPYVGALALRLIPPRCGRG